MNVTDPVGLAPPLTVAVSVKLPGAAIDEDEVWVLIVGWAFTTVNVSHGPIYPALL